MPTSAKQIMTAAPRINTGSTNNAPTTGQAIGNAFGFNNSVQYDNNLNLMNHANAFNQFMSDTAYQRTVSDMEKAGINPVVAFGLGRGQLDNSPQSAMTSTSSTAGIGGKAIISAINDISRMFDFIKFLG